MTARQLSKTCVPNVLRVSTVVRAKRGTNVALRILYSALIGYAFSSASVVEISSESLPTTTRRRGPLLLRLCSLRIDATGTVMLFASPVTYRFRRLVQALLEYFIQDQFLKIP